jgi:CBS domain-containing protein
VTAKNGRLAGIISDRDIVTQCVAKGIAPNETKVRDLCKYDPITITPNADIEYAVNRMLIRGVHRLPVVEKENIIVGMLSLDDVAADIQRDVGDFAQAVGVQAKR